MASNPSAQFSPLVSREQAGNAIRKALRLFVGARRHYTVKELSNGTGVKDRVIECAMLDPGDIDHRPLPSCALISIAFFLGPDFTNVWLKLADQQAVYRSPAGHDDVANTAIELAAEYARARHHDSECGIDIGPDEDRLLGEKRAALKAVA